jgi:glutathione synthase
MTINLGVVMDPIANINAKKDSTLAMLWEAKKRNWNLHYMELNDLFIRDGEAYGNMTALQVFQNYERWFSLGTKKTTPLNHLDVILMRKDPPFDTQYIYATYILEMAERQGTLVVNKPQSLRDCNEKIFTLQFPQCCPPSLITREGHLLKKFLEEHKQIILKILEGMGGTSVFLLKVGDPNVNVVIEILTQKYTQFIMAQKFVPEIEKGDKRILIVNGEPIPYGLTRIPASGDIRGNLAAGAKGVGVELTKRDYWICEQLASTLKEKGLIFVGIDVIGDYLTEINVTSPTCIREIDAAYGINIAEKLFNALEEIKQNEK